MVVMNGSDSQKHKEIKVSLSQGTDSVKVYVENDIIGKHMHKGKSYP